MSDTPSRKSVGGIEISDAACALIVSEDGRYDIMMTVPDADDPDPPVSQIELDFFAICMLYNRQDDRLVKLIDEEIDCIRRFEKEEDEAEKAARTESCPAEREEKNAVRILSEDTQDGI